MPSTTPIPEAVGARAARLAEPNPMRRGSVSERYMKCGQSGCRCQTDLQARHGPYYSLTRAQGGQTRSRYLTSEQAALARRQVETGHQFRQQVEAYWQACEQWADAQLETPEAVAQKGGSKRPSRPKSSRRSKRS